MDTIRATVVGLDTPRPLRLVGGKAANLTALIGAGFRVPGGFCVTTAAYARVAAAAGIDAAGVEAGGVEADGRARAALLAAPVPGDVAAEVRSAYAGFGPDVPVAVRSSATAEDLPSASFAGQQDTVLDVVGADAVLDAVRRCWASLWNDRAVSYRANAGIDPRGVALAVVVQPMVHARLAGVLFTADPVTGTRTSTVIDASPGPGEAVVSGAVDPDHLVVTGDGTVLERPAGARSCLSGAQVAELVALGRAVEARFGTPQDIEWVIDAAGSVWLTQSRPITTLHPLPVPRAAGKRAYLCASLAQGLTRPLTPMGLSAFRMITATAATSAFGVPVPDPRDGPPAFAEAGGRAFADITAVLRNPVGRAVVPRLLDIMEARSAVVLRALCQDPAFALGATTRFSVLRRLLRVLVRFRIPPLVALALARPAAARRQVDRTAERLRARGRPPADPSAAQRVEHVERLLAEVFPILPRVAPVAVAGLLMVPLARRLAGAELDGPTADEVLRSLPHNVTTGMDLELWALATRVRADAGAAAALREVGARELAARYHRGTLPPVLRDGLGGFLRRYGHRAAAEIDIGIPRWSDDPTQVLGVLANYLRLEDPHLAPDAVFARGAVAAEAAAAAVVARVRRRSRLRAAAVRLALRRARQLAGMRETHKDLLVRQLALARAQLVAVGAELADRGLLAGPDDVFFLDLREVREALGGADHRVRVAARREAYGHELRRRHVPRVLLSDGTEPEALAGPATAVPEGVLTGTPASAGTATGPARVVLDPVGAHLEPGEILVVPSTDPGWTPLFLTASGLVMEMGGPNSHGAVVAREYGIPAVVGVAGATSRITTGSRVTVDGAAGQVRPG